VTMHQQRGSSTPAYEDKTFQSVAAIIRDKSKEGLLVSMEEICEESIDQMPGTDKDGCSGIDLQTVLTEKMKSDGDLKTIRDPEGRSRYYSSQFMSEAYAKILIRKEGDPLVLIAETVRESSSLSSRPIPAVTFSAPPFRLSPVEISVCLQQMTEDSRFQDIRQTVTSIGTCFLYSTSHLEPNRAAMLSEWLDVGQHQNP